MPLPQIDSRGTSLLEVLLASLILGGAAASLMVFMFNSSKVVQSSQYEGTAINLARDVIEWGSAGRNGHPVAWRYANDNRGIEGLPNSVCAASIARLKGTNRPSGYGLTGWCYYNGTSTHPFRTMGDIKAQGLVPPSAPDSVVIVNEITKNPLFYNAYQNHVSVSWVEGGIARRRDMVVIALTQNNDQLRLVTNRFGWESAGWTPSSDNVGVGGL